MLFQYLSSSSYTVLNFQKNYLAFVHSTGSLEIYGKPLRDYFQLNNGLNLWWSSLISEKANWSKSPEIYTIIRILAFTKWSETNQITTLTLATSDKICSSFKLWCSRRNITFSLIFLAVQLSQFLHLSKSLVISPFLFKLLFGFFRYIIKRWSLKNVGLDLWRTTNNKLTFVSYLFNCPPAVISNFRFQSPYWGSLLNVLEQHDISSNWLHLYISDPLLPTSSSAAEALTSLNQRYAGHQVHVTLDSFLSPKHISSHKTGSHYVYSLLA